VTHEPRSAAFYRQRIPVAVTHFALWGRKSQATTLIALKEQ